MNSSLPRGALIWPSGCFDQRPFYSEHTKRFKMSRVPLRQQRSANSPSCFKPIPYSYFTLRACSVFFCSAGKRKIVSDDYDLMIFFSEAQYHFSSIFLSIPNPTYTPNRPSVFQHIFMLNKKTNNKKIKETKEQFPPTSSYGSSTTKKNAPVLFN
jgi:hypothetical protein